MTYASQPSDPEKLPDTPALAAFLAAAQRAGTVRPEDEERALEAFRSARDGGVHAARTPLLRRRRRDDWRPASARRARPARMLLGGFVIAATLGGVAVAANSGVLPSPFDRPDPREPVRPVHSATATPAAPARGADGSVTPRPPTAAPGAGQPTGGPSRGPGDGALCEAYRKAGNGGKATHSTAFDRLESAAGGPAEVRAYCDALLGPASQEKRGDAQPGEGKARNSARPTPGNGKADSNASSGSNGGSSGSTDANAGSNGNAGSNASSGSNGNANGNAGGNRSGNAKGAPKGDNSAPG
ncbi:hypothetical protein [Streptomyces griseus]|uniref:hypothetical protein n=1 Tax=Streptomyces griseus TaxID=1911 RepID=UPI0008400AC2|nr:hypothetical protein [Streptomyces griseus]